MVALKPLLGSLALAVASTAALPSAGKAAEPPARITATVDATIRPLMAKYDVPGLALAITVDGQRYFFNYGVSSKETGKPVTENTLFEIGSLSKTFTATLICYAQALGQVSLADHAGMYLPALATQRHRPRQSAGPRHLHGRRTAAAIS